MCVMESKGWFPTQMLTWHKWVFLALVFKKRGNLHVRLPSDKCRLINICCRELISWFAIFKYRLYLFHNRKKGLSSLRIKCKNCHSSANWLKSNDPKYIIFKNFKPRCPRMEQYLKYCFHHAITKNFNSVLQIST